MENSGGKGNYENYSINNVGPINLKCKSESDAKNGAKSEVEPSPLPLNLSPSAPQTSDKVKAPPRLESEDQNYNNDTLVKTEQRISPSPLNSWTGLCRTQYFFPPFQFPFLYPASEAIPSSAPPTVGPPLSEPKSSDLDQRNSPRTSPLKPLKQEFGTRYENTYHGSSIVSPSERSDSNPESQYQVKWANHASRLSSFVSSLEGEVASSDTIISLKDGTTFYAHRLVLACASPFFTRTLKNVPKDQHAVVVVPRATAKIMMIILNFSYTGMAEFPSEDLQDVFELAEDLEITGLLHEKAKKIILTPSCPTTSPSSVFTPNLQPPTSFLPENPFDAPSTSNDILCMQKSGSSFPSVTWKRENVFNYNQPLKRIKSDSDAFKSTPRKPVKFSHSEPSKVLCKSESPQLPATLLPFSCYSNPSSPTLKNLPESPTEELSPPGIIIPRHAGTGSRVLLWRFLLQLLHDHRYSPYYIRWLDRPHGIFRIMESDKVAQLWGLARKNKNMTYEKMSRGMRTYYKRSILYHLDGTKLIYRFNTQEPEIQHQMKYYELMSRGLEDQDSKLYSMYLNAQSSSDKTSTVASDQNGSPRSNVDLTSASEIHSSSLPLSPHFLSELPSNIYNLGSLLPPPHSSNS